jgi:hypothetical protein
MIKHYEWLLLQQFLAWLMLVKMYLSKDDNQEKHGRKIIEE